MKKDRIGVWYQRFKDAAAEEDRLLVEYQKLKGKGAGPEAELEARARWKAACELTNRIFDELPMECRCI